MPLKLSPEQLHPLTEQISSLAVQAAVYEATTTMKPGLVCMDTRGCHTDMDIRTLVSSAFALQGYFKAALTLGIDTRHEPGAIVFRHLRPLGLQAEADMFAATRNINTHKGLIFTLGLLLAALGRSGTGNIDILCKTASEFVTGIMQQELYSLTERIGSIDTDDLSMPLLAKKIFAVSGIKLTAGELLYLCYGATGVRGEAENGFFHIRAAAVFLQEYEKKDDWNKAIIATLLQIMSKLEDTNILWRGNAKQLAALQNLALQAMAAGGPYTEQGLRQIEQLQEYCLRYRLSPGGAADILCASIFLYLLKKSGLLPELA